MQHTDLGRMDHQALACFHISILCEPASSRQPGFPVVRFRACCPHCADQWPIQHSAHLALAMQDTPAGHMLALSSSESQHSPLHGQAFVCSRALWQQAQLKAPAPLKLSGASPATPLALLSAPWTRGLAVLNAADALQSTDCTPPPLLTSLCPKVQDWFPHMRRGLQCLPCPHPSASRWPRGLCVTSTSSPTTKCSQMQ